MLRIICIALGTFLLAACANQVRDAQDALSDSLAIKQDVEFRAMQTYPGDVVCGEFSAFISWTEPKQGFKPFIRVRDELLDKPSKEQEAIYCSPDSAGALLKIYGLGPYTAGDTTLSKLVGDFTALGEALERYYQDNFYYPTADQGLQALVSKPTSGRQRPFHYAEGGYIDAIPTDPWGRPYQYWEEQWGRTKGRYRITTLGADGAPGGSGENADVNSDLLPYLEHVLHLLGRD